MSQPWSHLPNAAHIDRILADLRARPEAWAAARAAAWDAVGDAAWEAALDAAWNVCQDTARAPAWDAAWDSVQDVAWDAVAALLAWDDCAHLLDTDPDQVRVLALLGQPAAVLLYPACRVLKSSNESMTYST